ncbi:MAG: recombinase family protein [Syntrophobacteraceae bacterium]|jgi:DNA invertase Pin-like site-specific DNA recombinase
MKTQAFGYLRVSDSSQVKRGGVERDGFRRQEDAIRAYAAKAGYEIVQLFKDDVSGTKDESDRPAWLDMLSAILANGVRVIIVERLDRLARAFRVQESLLIYLASKGITLINASTEEDVTAAIEADPMKKALVQIQGIFAELEKSLLVKKLRAARDRARAEKGKCEGRKSYVEVAPRVIEEIKRLRRKPKGGRRMTYVKIAEELNRQGFKTVSDKPFTGQTVQNVLFSL